MPAKIDREGKPEDVHIARQIIARVWEQYGKHTAAELTGLTHSPDSPWSQVANKDQPYTIIPDESIREYFVRQATAVV